MMACDKWRWTRARPASDAREGTPSPPINYRLAAVGREKTKKHNNQLVGHETIYFSNEGAEKQSEMLGGGKKRRGAESTPPFLSSPWRDRPPRPMYAFPLFPITKRVMRQKKRRYNSQPVRKVTIYLGSRRRVGRCWAEMRGREEWSILLPLLACLFLSLSLSLSLANASPQTIHLSIKGWRGI